jgi:hypothetical protein
MTRDPALCHRCAARFTPAEWVALCRTGLAGERDGQPVIAALLLPRQGIVQFAGMPESGLVEWETPIFRCPWSPLELPPVLRHGPSFRSANGHHSDILELDAQGCFHRRSHCPSYNGAYFVRPFTDPTLPRRALPLW